MTQAAYNKIEPPRYIFSKDECLLTGLTERIRNSGHIILFLDYDGTLVPIRRTPTEAVLSAKMQNLLHRLSACRNIQMVFITGRSHQDIRNLVKLKNGVYISNHGFQISYGKKNWTHPGVKSKLAIIEELYSSLNNLLKDFTGTIIENKGFTLSVHYRMEDRTKVPALRELIKNALQYYSEDLKLTNGKKVFEIRPRIKWNKGYAALKFLEQLEPANKQNVLTIYLGDDATDEDAFKLLKGKSITIRVGEGNNTEASFYIRNVKETEDFLSAAADAAEDSRIHS